MNPDIKDALVVATSIFVVLTPIAFWIVILRCLLQ